MSIIDVMIRNSVMKDVARELELLSDLLVGCTIDFHSKSVEVIRLKELAEKLRVAADE